MASGSPSSPTAATSASAGPPPPCGRSTWRAARRLISEELGAHSPSWSPDGRTIAFLAGPRRRGVGHTDLYAGSAESQLPGAERSLTADFTPTCADTCIDDMRSSHGEAPLTWSPDSA